MENYKVKGKITEISEVQTLDNGAKKLTYRIDNGNQYSNIMEFEVYNKAEKSEHTDNFVKYNKVGEDVEVEFNIKTRPWENKIFTNLSSCKCNKLVPAAASPSLNASDTEDSSDLPF